MSRYLKVFFRFFHKAWWIVILGAILLRIFLPESYPFSDFLINIAATFLLLKVTTFIHEYGHLVAAHFVGATPRRMILGIGHEILRTEIRGVRVILNSIPLGGMAWATFDENHSERWRYAVYLAGGVVLNLLVALVFYLFFGLNPSYLTGRQGVDITSPIILTNLFCVLNLLPFYTSFYGPRSGTDGLRLLQLVFDFKGKFKEYNGNNELFDAHEYMEKRNYDKAYTIFQNYTEKFPEEVTVLLNMSVIHLRQGQLDDSLNILQHLEKKIESKPFKNYRGYVYNNIACIHLVRNDIDLAYHYATLALKAMPKSNFVWGTYGSALIERGKLLEGMQWLFKNMDLEHPNSTTLTSSMYLMVAFHKRGDMKSRNMHMNFVKKNIELLEKDEVIIFERNLEKIGEFNGIKL